uniref:Uncharacterized protein n=1 Tax=Prymnesium polylepis TaxID=72548 RepID=A0A7S4MA33_9EUKA
MTELLIPTQQPSQTYRGLPCVPVNAGCSGYCTTGCGALGAAAPRLPRGSRFPYDSLLSPTTLQLGRTFVIVIDIGGERDAPHLLLLHHRLPRRLLLVAPPLAPSPPPLLNRRPPHLRLLRLDLPPCHRLDRHPLRSSPLRHLLLLLLELVVSHYCAGSIDTYGEVRRGGPTEERPLLGGRA